MDTEHPLNKLNLVASSIAEDLGFVALADIMKALKSVDAMRDCRLIGGHMVMMHVHRWGLGRELYRETRDADIGVASITLRRIDTVSLLEALGYQKVSGCRFQRALGKESSKAIIDLLVPSYTSRARKSVKIGKLVTTEVPGLAEALKRDPVEIKATLHRLNGEQLNATLILPDEIAALCLKALAFRERAEGKDAVDVWRCIEVMHLAGISFPQNCGGDLAEVHSIITAGFATKTSPMMRALIDQQGLSKQAAQKRHTHIQALIKNVF